jgi:hypothetical protein
MGKESSSVSKGSLNGWSENDTKSTTGFFSANIELTPLALFAIIPDSRKKPSMFSSQERTSPSSATFPFQISSFSLKIYRLEISKRRWESVFSKRLMIESDLWWMSDWDI